MHEMSSHAHLEGMGHAICAERWSTFQVSNVWEQDYAVDRLVYRY